MPKQAIEQKSPAFTIVVVPQAETTMAVSQLLQSNEVLQLAHNTMNSCKWYLLEYETEWTKQTVFCKQKKYDEVQNR